MHAKRREQSENIRAAAEMKMAETQVEIEGIGQKRHERLGERRGMSH